MSVSVIEDLSYPIMVDGAGGSASGKRYGGAFQTLAQAQAVALAGDTVFVRPSTYSPASNIHKNRVNWHFASGAMVNFTGTGTPPSRGLFDIASAESAVITGDGEFTNAGAVLLTTFNSSAKLVFRAKSISSTSTAVYCDVGTLEVDCPSIIGSPQYVIRNIGTSASAFLKIKNARIIGSNTGGVDSVLDFRGVGTTTFEDCTVFHRPFTRGTMWVQAGTPTINLTRCDMYPAFSTTAGGLLINSGATVNLTDSIIRAKSGDTNSISKTAGTGQQLNYFGTTILAKAVSGAFTVTGTPTTDASYAVRTYTFSGTTLTSTTHGYSTARAVRFQSTTTNPTGVNEGVTYYVRNLTANTFSVHPTAGDATANTNAISLSGGSGTHYVFGM